MGNLEIDICIEGLKELSKSIDELSENMQKAGDLFLQIADTQIQMLEAELDKQIRMSKPEAFFLDKDLQEKLI